MPHNERGFTIVELMIAISILSITVLLTTGILTGIAKQYQRATYNTKLNDASRNVHSVIGDSISYGGTITAILGPTNGYKYFCADQIRYYWKTSTGSAISTPSGLYRDKINCDNAPTDTTAASAENMLPVNGFVTQLSISSSGLVYNIATTFKVGSPEMFTDSNNIGGVDTFCRPALRGGDFCSQVSYNSVVVKKVGSNL